MADLKTATLGAGCFQGIEAAFRKIFGVMTTESGYSGERMRNP